mmetsp:Transcript_10915/g.16522  ORF Transcript_10915/g.16522 Transcript_10915/m.16522 type:complete len:86 (-) Transcript_10915:127-384(-)
MDTEELNERISGGTDETQTPVTAGSNAPPKKSTTQTEHIKTQKFMVRAEGMANTVAPTENKQHTRSVVTVASPDSSLYPPNLSMT